MRRSRASIRRIGNPKQARRQARVGEPTWIVDVAWAGDREIVKVDVVGSTGGTPAAFEAPRPRELLVALHDGVIKRSIDA